MILFNGHFTLRRPFESLQTFERMRAAKFIVIIVVVVVVVVVVV